MSMDDLIAQKKAIRERILAARAEMGVSERAVRSAEICHRIANLPDFAAAESILFYMPFRGEVDVLPLLTDALSRGIRCALPRCCPGKQLRLFRVTDPVNDVEQGCWGIQEPKDCLNECSPADFSVIIVPGVAFDRSGVRLGYGAGYYDRMLSGTRALTIAPAFSLQVIPKLPFGAHDAPADIVVTEDEIIDCRRAGE